MKIHKYADIIREYFYLDSDNKVRYAKQGYYNRYNQHDLVKPYPNATNYKMLRIPTNRSTIHFSHIVALLYFKDLPDKFEIDHKDSKHSY